MSGPPDGTESYDMSSQLHALCFDAVDAPALTRFWAGVLGWEIGGDDALTLVPNDDTGFQLRFTPTDLPKVGPNRVHFDLTSTSLDDQQATVDRALALGGRHIDVGQLPEEGHVVLADPEGNEFCVIEPGNNFLADCGFLGALSGDGTQAVGYFWSAALGWPLVWDQDEETAIRSPHGGPKVTWGGPPVEPKNGPSRQRFELVVGDETTVAAEVDRLVALGATRADDGQDDRSRVLMRDPDDNDFSVR